MFYMTQGKTFTHFYKGTAGNTCSLDAIYVTKAAIKSKINYIQPATVFDSCASWNLQPDIKIIAWMVNHTTLLWKNGAFNGWITAAGYQQSYLIKGNEILQCVKQNVTETSQTNSLLVGKKSVKVSHWRRNEDWQKSSVSSFKVIIGKKRMMINAMLSYVDPIHCWTYFWFLFFPFSSSSLPRFQRCQSEKWLPIVKIQAGFLYE